MIVGWRRDVGMMNVTVLGIMVIEIHLVWFMHILGLIEAVSLSILFLVIADAIAIVMMDDRVEGHVHLTVVVGVVSDGVTDHGAGSGKILVHDGLFVVEICIPVIVDEGGSSRVAVRRGALGVVTRSFHRRGASGVDGPGEAHAVGVKMGELAGEVCSAVSFGALHRVLSGMHERDAPPWRGNQRFVRLRVVMSMTETGSTC